MVNFKNCKQSADKQTKKLPQQTKKTVPFGHLHTYLRMQNLPKFKFWPFKIGTPSNQLILNIDLEHCTFSFLLNNECIVTMLFRSPMHNAYPFLIMVPKETLVLFAYYLLLKLRARCLVSSDLTLAFMMHTDQQLLSSQMF